MGKAMERKLYYSWWHSLGLLFYGGFSGLFCVCLICFALWVDRAVLSDISYWFLLLLTLFSWLFYWLQYAVVLPMLLLRKPVVRMDEQGIAAHDALNFFSKHRKWSTKWDNIRAVDVGMEALKKHHPLSRQVFTPAYRSHDSAAPCCLWGRALLCCGVQRDDAGAGKRRKRGHIGRVAGV